MNDYVENRLSIPNPALAFAGLIIIIVVGLFTILNYQPIPAKPADTPADKFSAERVKRILERLFPGEIPHPIGSAEHGLVLDRIIGEFHALGMETEIQETAIGTSWRNYFNLKNLLVHIPGSGGDKTIIVMSHYDSVAAGPGIADDGHAVAATIEIARLLKEGEKLHHNVLLLITDGEEFGMLGARAFVRDNPAIMEDLVAVLNMEARGTSGPSFMFETGPGSSRLVGHFTGNSPKPLATSLFPAVYDQMPNDSDLSIFKDEGYPGLNFAFIGNLPHYHTPNDNLENLSLSSVQHQGENVYNALQAIANDESLPKSSGDVVFFDIAGLFVISWPNSSTSILATIALILIIVSIVILFRSKLLKLSQLIWSLISFVLLLVFAIASGYGVVFAFRAISDENSPWVAYPLIFIATVWVAASAMAMLVYWLFHKKVSATGAWASSWLWLSTLGVVLAFFMPGASYLLVFPSLIAGILGALFFLKILQKSFYQFLVFLLPGLVTMALLIVLSVVGYDALGLDMSPIITAPLALIYASAAPFLVQFSHKLLGLKFLVQLGLVVILIIVTIFFPAYTSFHQRPMNIFFVTNTVENESWWSVSRRAGSALNEALGSGLLTEEPTVTLLPWNEADRIYTGTADNPGVAAPELTIESIQGSTAGVRYLLKFVSNRNAPMARLVFPPNHHPLEVRVNGHLLGVAAEEENYPEDEWKWYSSMTTPAEGVIFDVLMPDYLPVDLYYYDMSWGLPNEAGPLANARPAEATAIHSGDNWLIFGKILLRQQNDPVEEEQ